mmetsp:Transcript_22177/g.76074  ORF Transcript_22177/g.76074 Transcript_22177/m.76074 type:complete len:368 (+) Transcript_22177:677-1780(+)
MEVVVGLPLRPIVIGMWEVQHRIQRVHITDRVQPRRSIHDGPPWCVRRQRHPAVPLLHLEELPRLEVPFPLSPTVRKVPRHGDAAVPEVENSLVLFRQPSNGAVPRHLVPKLLQVPICDHALAQERRAERLRAPCARNEDPELILNRVHHLRPVAGAVLASRGGQRGLGHGFIGPAVELPVADQVVVGALVRARPRHELGAERDEGPLDPLEPLVLACGTVARRVHHFGSGVHPIPELAYHLVGPLVVQHLPGRGQGFEDCTPQRPEFLAANRSNLCSPVCEEPHLLRDFRQPLARESTGVRRRRAGGVITGERPGIVRRSARAARAAGVLLDVDDDPILPLLGVEPGSNRTLLQRLVLICRFARAG